MIISASFEKVKQLNKQLTKLKVLDSFSLHNLQIYFQSQRKQKETRRKSSPKDERRNKSPEGFEQTTKTLKKLIKGEDKRKR